VTGRHGDQPVGPSGRPRRGGGGGGGGAPPPPPPRAGCDDKRARRSRARGRIQHGVCAIRPAAAGEAAVPFGARRAMKPHAGIDGFAPGPLVTQVNPTLSFFASVRPPSSQHPSSPRQHVARVDPNPNPTARTGPRSSLRRGVSASWVRLVFLSTRRRW